MPASLPNELLGLILSFVDEEDILAVLLTCRLWHGLGLPRYSQIHFSLMVLDLEGPSLERAIRVIQNDAYRAAVMTIGFSPHRFFGRQGEWRRDTDGTLVSSRHWDTIQKVLTADYPNLAKITITSDEDQVFPEYWDSPRVATLPEVIGFAFHLIATARHPIRYCDIQLHPRLAPFCFPRVKIPEPISEQFWLRWADLYHLNLDTNADTNGQDAVLLGDLIANAHQLKRLKLGNCMQNPSGNSLRLLDQLIVVPLAPPLTHLSITRALFQSPDELMALIKRFKHSLKHISLEFVAIAASWAEVFAQMQQELTALKSFSILTCHEITDSSQGLHNRQLLLLCPLLHTIPQDKLPWFHFREYLDKRRRRMCLSAVQYKGPDVRWALGLIKDAVYTLNSPPEDLQIYEQHAFERISLDIDYSEFEF